VHVDPPVEHKAYLHRSGRTARAGSAGDVVTIMLPEQRRDTKDILRKAAIKVDPIVVTAASPEVTSLVGEVAAYVTPAPRQTPQRGGGTSQGANAQRKRAARGESGTGGARRGRGGRGGNAAAAEAQGAPQRTAHNPNGGQSARGGQGGKGRGAQRSAAPARPSSGRTSAGTPTTGMVVGARSPRTNRRAQG